MGIFQLPWFLNPWAEVRRLRRDVRTWEEDSKHWSGQWYDVARRTGTLQAENADLRRRIAEMEKCPELNVTLEVGAPDVTEALCGCQRCTDARPGFRGWDQPGWRYACELCGNKRCPHHDWHGFTCTGSNEPDQIGRPL